MDLFDRCYNTRVDGLSGTPSLERIALPDEGGVNDQDERDMNALEHIASVTRVVLNERVKRNRDKAQKEKDSELKKGEKHG